MAEYETLVYAPEKGIAYVRRKDSFPSERYVEVRGSHATVAIALEAAQAQGLNPTAVFYRLDAKDADPAFHCGGRARARVTD